MSLRRFFKTAVFCGLVASSVLACDDGTPPPPPAPDGGPSGDPPSPIGTVGYLDLRYENLPPPFDGLGNGPLAAIGPFEDIEEASPPVYQENGSQFGCKVFELTPEQFLSPGIDIGTVNYTVHGGDWVTPPCVIVPDVGWACPGAMGTGGDIAVVDAEMGIYSLTDPSAGFTGDDEVGRYLSISGASVAGNNGFFFVVGSTDPDNILFFNPGPGGVENNTDGGYATIGGFGPAGRDDPIPDDALLEVSLEANEDSGLADFHTFVPFGTSFTLDDSSQETISDIPMDGSGFEIGCHGEGGECGPAFADVLIIDTSDGPLDDLPPFLLPTPAEKSVKVFCLSLVGTKVPAEASAFLADSGATRIRTVSARIFPTDVFSGTGKATVLAGHAQAGFTDP
jgi:hypothetical protein